MRRPGRRERDGVDVDDEARHEPVTTTAAPEEPTAHRRLSVWQETLLLLGAALVLSFVVKTFFVQAFYIPSGSMEPGLEVNDRILVQKVSYWRGTPERGDTVVFEDPGGWLGPGEDAAPTTPVTTVLGKVGLYPTGGHLVKRVIGVAGDVVECCDDDGRILVNGTPLGRGFTKNPQKCDGPMVNDCGSDWSTGPVPDGYVFVLGDHRNASADSSVHICRKNETECVPGEEFVPTDLVVGKVFARVWPADRFAILDKPATFADLD